MHIHNLAHPMSITHQIALSHTLFRLLLLSPSRALHVSHLSLLNSPNPHAIAMPGLIKPSRHPRARTLPLLPVYPYCFPAVSFLRGFSFALQQVCRAEGRTKSPAVKPAHAFWFQRRSIRHPRPVFAASLSPYLASFLLQTKTSSSTSNTS
ncbi:hypothetical protein LZ30DRAFT_26989 [Colletotrichum cereale]|nr:hypothetical protein LZ30DRAFT_26989 [Colletotrichum cereale]